MDPPTDPNAPSVIAPPASRDGFHIAIICALPRESDAIELLFDEFYDDHHKYGRSADDDNTYTTGRIGQHSVVLVVLPKMGVTAAVLASIGLRTSFSNVKLALLVGICGGLPSIGGQDAFLGDVIISTSIFNHDFGRSYTTEFVPKTSIEDSLNHANDHIRGLINSFQRMRIRRELQTKATKNLSRLQDAAKQHGDSRYKHPSNSTDKIYSADYEHKHRDKDNRCTQCDAIPAAFCPGAAKMTCTQLGCEEAHLAPRMDRLKKRPVGLVPQIFLGRVASGNAVMKSGSLRDGFANKHDVIAFEMEGAGAWEKVPCIVVKGICDYADSHKNKQWQDFAAATAASVAVAIFDRYELPDGVSSRPAAAEGGQPIPDSLSRPQHALAQPSHAFHNHGGVTHSVQGSTFGDGANIHISAVYHTAAPETPPQPFATIPFSRDPDFVDRGDILDQLLQRCSEPAGRMALVGLGGIGKSQLAIEFAHRAAEKTPNKWIFWIHAGTQARVEEGFQAIADVVKLPGRNQPKADVLQLVYGWLSNEQNGRWTIILDSADNGGVFYATNDGRKGKPLANYLPQSRNGSIVVTTRNRDLAFRLTGDHKNIIDIKPMVLADALLLLKKKLGPLPDTDTAKALVQALDLVPLAISQAAAYIQARSPLSSVGKYLAEFQKGEYKRTRLLSHDAGDLRRDGGASNAILTTWQISFEHIRSERPSAADLLALMSFFDRQGIALSLLKPLNTENVQWDSGSESGSSSDEADDGFEDDVAILRGFCLVSASENASAASEDAKALEMHGLVQLSMRQWLEADGLQNKFRRQFVERIAAAFPTGDYSNWATCQKLFAHVDAAMNCRPTEEGTQELWAGLMYRGGWYALEQGKYGAAEQMVGKSKRSREKQLGNSDEKTLNSVALYAEIFRNQGRWQEAEKLEVEVMETRKTKLGVDHPDTLTSMANLASTFWNQGRWEEAEKLEVEVMETSKTKLGVDHPDTLRSMNNLASTFWNQGRWEEAEKLQVEVMETRKTKLGVDHPDTLTSMNNLALTWKSQGRWQEAEKLNVEVMETSKTKLGVDHPDTLRSMNNLALTFWNQGRWEEAEKLQVEVMETRKTKLGVDHPDTLTSMANLASTFWNQGRWEEAEKLEVEVMETSKTKLGVDHPDTLTSMANLASTFWNQGRWEEAEKLEVEVMETSKTKLGVDHPDTLTSMANLASTFWNQGRWEEAEKLNVEVMETSKTKLGVDHPDTLTSMANLASTFWNQGRWEEAEKLEVEVMETSKTKLGVDHPDTLTSMNNLAFTWKSQGRHKDALALMKHCAQTRQRVLGLKHPDTVSSLSVVTDWTS
ncbi:hypothetical protein RB597_005851 [Gaeumannomyces tritici]